ncbi:hypothetical protein LOTGIDRAFT_154834 [Lottia gigantea]|uniref:Uncharacterized protein n=1 Tax=Lottia gigantea TaxID=225164 RepID=V3ZSL4_LOTGI|nr:hypothetical protein LOTGIDRAFT_154834 [Lottia gigantea]ESO87337.1 hypothetical protein LOTGIDRAFT_154834 [Lottia gigantea]
MADGLKNPVLASASDSDSDDLPRGTQKMASTKKIDSSQLSLPGTSNTFLKNIETSMDHIAQFMESMNEAFTGLAEEKRKLPEEFIILKKKARRRVSDTSSDEAEKDFIAMANVNRPKAYISDSDEENTNRSQLDEGQGDGGASSSFDSFLDNVEDELQLCSKSGQNINDKLAKFVTKRFETRLSFDKLQERIDKYSIPRNCEGVYVSEVNLPIKSKLNRFIRGLDTRTSNIQRTIVSASSAVIECLELVSSNMVAMNGTPELVSKLTDAVSMLGHANYDISLRRREYLRPYIQDDYKPLCGQMVPVTKLLFGDDLQKEMKEVRETNLIAKTVNKSKGNYSSYNHNQFDNSKSHHGASGGYQKYPFRERGLMTSSFPGTIYGALYYRDLENEKTVALKHNKGNFEASIILGSLAKKELTWWVQSLKFAYNVIDHGSPDVTIYTDASKNGWGCTE